MGDVLLRVDSHHLAQPLIVNLVHLLHQWTYTQVSVSIYEYYFIHERSSPPHRLASLGSATFVDLVHLLHQCTYTQVSVSIYE
jgi:hypothetical protein